MFSAASWWDEWRATAAAMLGVGAFAYCEVSGLASGNGPHLPLSAAWAGLVVTVFAVTAAAVVGWRGLVAGASARAVGTLAVLGIGGLLFVAGEKLLALLYWQKPWGTFAADFVSRAPVMLLVLAALDGPRWLTPRQVPRPGRIAFDVPARDGMVRVPVDAVSRVIAAGNYVEIHADGRCLLLRSTLAAVAGRLAAHGFVRVHRSALVNMRFVAARRGSVLHLRDGTRVRIGRRYRETLLVATPFVTESGHSSPRA